MNRKLTYLLIFMLFLAPLFTHAQLSETPAEKQARLQSELAQVEKEQAETEKILADAQNQSASLGRDILILNTKIKAAQLNIKVKNLLIESLGKDIVKKQDKINVLDDRIGRGKETLAQIMRKTDEVDSYTLPEIILAKENLSTLFSDIDTFESVQSSLKITFEQIRSDKSQTQSEKDALGKKKNQESDARTAIVTEQNNIQANEKEKQRLLTVSKGNEKTYSQVLAEKKIKAAQIRAALFALAGGSNPIPFGDALRFAQAAAKSTGIRPAFLLAVITQESNLGANVGSCYITDINTGAGVSAKSSTVFSNVMKPGRDVQPFLDITHSLGLDPMKTLVSCPQAIGWGGAMGPAQFIASTWMLFKDRIAQALNVAIANPWSPQDAFVASSLYLTDLGAMNGSYIGELRAACKYFGSGGTSCSYGNQVMAKANAIQTYQIDPLQGL